jgi:hypothetical protein
MTGLRRIQLGGSTYSKTATSGTQYMVFAGHGSPDTATDDNMWMAPCAGILKNFYVYGSVALTGTMTIQVQVYKIGTGATALTVTLSASGQTGNDVSHSATVAKGELYCILATYTNTPTTQGIAHTCEFVPKPEEVA